MSLCSINPLERYFYNFTVRGVCTHIAFNFVNNASFNFPSRQFSNVRITFSRSITCILPTRTLIAPIIAFSTARQRIPSYPNGCFPQYSSRLRTIAEKISCGAVPHISISLIAFKHIQTSYPLFSSSWTAFHSSLLCSNTRQLCLLPAQNLTKSLKVLRY